MKMKGTAYKKMLLSFIVVFCLPLCLTIAFYFYSDRVTEKQLETSNANLLQTIRNVCDQEIQFYQNILLECSADSTVKELGSLDELTGFEYEIIEELDEKLARYAVSIAGFNKAGKDIFVYFPKIGHIGGHTSSVVTVPSYFEGVLIRDENVRAQIMQQLHIKSDFTPNVYPNKRWAGNMLLITRTCWQRAENCEATVGIWISCDQFAKHVASVDWTYGFEWLILDEENRVIVGTENVAKTGSVFDEKALTGSGDYLVNRIGSRNTGWSYVLLTPKGVVREFSSQIRLFFFVSLALCVLLGYFVTRKIAVMNYAPLENLLRSFQSKKEATARKKDEYSFLQEQIATLQASKTDLQKTISRSGKAMKKWALIDLLTKPYLSNGGIGETGALFELFGQGSNIVLLIREKMSDTSQPDPEENDSLKMFIIDNVFNEKVGEVFHCAMVELDGRQVLVVNDGGKPGMEEKLWEIVCDLQVTVMEYFTLSIAIAAGGRHVGLQGIHESYLEAREAEEFIPVLEQDFITYDEIRDNTHRKYDYSTQTEERILSAILNNNAELANAFIDKLLELNFTQNRTTSNMRRCLLMDLYCTLLKAADEKGCIEQVDVRQNSFSIEQPVQELKERYFRLVQRICEQTPQGAEVSSDKELCQKVLAYVRENYSNLNLNVSQVAQQFHLSPSNLSAIYKKETGRSLLKEINEIRIEYAVVFLRQGYSVVETAEKVGITESSSFIRLFKKYMGITPGQMKSRMNKTTEQQE